MTDEEVLQALEEAKVCAEFGTSAYKLPQSVSPEGYARKFAALAVLLMPTKPQPELVAKLAVVQAERDYAEQELKTLYERRHIEAWAAPSRGEVVPPHQKIGESMGLSENLICTGPRSDARDCPIHRPKASEGGEVVPACVFGQYCHKHGFIHGAEASELRERLEKVLTATQNIEYRLYLQALLDEVDARDSLAWAEHMKKEMESPEVQRFLNFEKKAREALGLSSFAHGAAGSHITVDALVEQLKSVWEECEGEKT